MSAILDKWDRLLVNWALWQLSGNGSAGVSTAYRDEWWLYAPRQPLPLVGEALDTDTLIGKLPQEFREIIVAVYVWSVPETMEARARILRIHVNTLYDKLRRAKLRLDDLDQERKHAMRGYNNPMLGFGMA